MIAITALVGAWSLSNPAWAGIPECNGLRLEDAYECEVRGDLQCTGGCDDLGIYKKSCATYLHTECREECTLDPEPSCTDECTEQCSADCDAGVSVICAHNCFGECVGSCSATCADAEDPTTCRASCEATCDGECDIRCEATLDGSCYKHCIECCGGSCGAQANMTCQTQCQDRQFEACEHEFRAECSASCSGDGALFCDGEYVMSGPELDTCLDALIARGVAEAEKQINDALDDYDAFEERQARRGSFCRVDANPSSPPASLLLLLGFALLRRRPSRRGPPTAPTRSRSRGPRYRSPSRTAARGSGRSARR